MGSEVIFGAKNVQKYLSLQIENILNVKGEKRGKREKKGGEKRKGRKKGEEKEKKGGKNTPLSLFFFISVLDFSFWL